MCDDPGLDNLTALACCLCDTPIALLRRRNDCGDLLQSHIGLSGPEAEALYAFARVAADGEAFFCLSDTRADERWRGHPLLRPLPFVRFIAGVSVVDSEDRTIGALVVADGCPRTLGGSQIEGLHRIARESRRGALAPGAAERRPAGRAIDGDYRSLFDCHHAVMLLIDPENGSIVDANQAACRFYGYSHEHITCLTIQDINTLSQDSVRQEMRSARTAQRTFFQFGHRLATGEVRDVEVYSGPAALRGRSLLFSIVHDVTERRAMEERLRKFQQAVEQSPVSVAIVDLLGAVEYVNRRFTQLTGYSLDDVRGRDLGMLRSDETPPDVYFQLIEAIQSGREWHGEVCTRRKDGATFWETASVSAIRNAEGECTHYLQVTEDITERRNAADALRHSTEMLQALVQACPVAILALDPDRTVRIWNPAAERIFGWTVGEVIDGPFPLVPPDRGQDADVLRDSILQGEGFAGEERQRLRKDGSLVDVSISTAPTRDRNGRINGIMAVYADISERAYAERERFAFLRDTLSSVTGGRLRVCRTREDLPAPLPLTAGPIPLSSSTLIDIRHAVDGAASTLGFPEERRYDVVTAVGEAGMNAVVHANGGQAHICTDAARRTLQVWIEDNGAGIALGDLPRATLEPGYTTAGSMGMGMPIMVQTSDRLWLLTGPEGTTVVLEKGAEPVENPPFFAAGGF